ncbi:hypothetical protein [Sphingomonas sp. ERG5]|uniref:hypothetical protein n=1 Tax=Sphingomonas sp. ERG5 TaxID=1381597 RepID=UPI0009E05C7A|nr:hypothetical protein [Sphingomonas sp. ERG5]
MRPWHYLLLLTALPSAYAAASEPAYYGPMKAWHGIGYQFGYKEDPQKDGSWRVVASTQRGEAIDMAMYRAAELAREQGFAYVELLGGSMSRSPGFNSATLYARPSHTPSPPAACRTKRPSTCYTAVAADILRRLGGTGGAHPGVPVVDHLDQYGRAVSYSGYGIGAAPPIPPRPLPPVPSVVRNRAPVSGTVKPDAAAEYERALKAAQPVRGREPKQGWTVSD